MMVRARVCAVAIIGALASAAEAQPAREAALRAAIVAEPGDLDRYLQLANYHQQRGELERANQALQDALGVDPSSRSLHERRVRLFATPFTPSRIGRNALEWMSVDGTNAVPVLLVAGYRMRRASGLRGDGTSASLDELDLALRDLEGAVPANPQHAGLAAARVTLLQAKGALTSDPVAASALRAEAREAQADADALASAERQPYGGLGPLASLVAAMFRPVPFGPPDAVRAGAMVPRPALLRQVPVPGPRPSPGQTRRLLTLEIVVGRDGRIVQIFPLDASEGYDTAIAEAVGQWVFSPTTLNGEPVPVILTVTVPAR